ncbi:efflux RND transporter periplasmic adaptor subunit [Methylobacterium sp. ID0610]|uniref:efflux RND transporter periplasmic adaptor subunit n=1 Tax=Methylobacterium carpenticola TaxID=3344827 RepID=UPI0036996091
MLNPYFGAPRRFPAVLAGLPALVLSCLMLAATSTGAPAHEGHDHGNETPLAANAGSPRVATHSDQYELVGILKQGRLTLYLDRFADNATVTDAKITASLGNAEVAAEATPDGTYTVSSPKLAGHGPLEVVFNVQAPGGEDLLIGTLPLPAEPSAVAATASTSGIEGIRQSLRSLGAGTGSPYSLAGGTLVLGLLLGLALRSRSRWVPATAVGLTALLVSAGYALAHEGHDHGREPAAAATSDAPQRLPDGNVFLPKPSQRLMEVRTAVTRPETAQRGVQLIGRVIADPNRSGLVQSINGGRVSAPERGLPRIGQSVKKGDILATVEPALPLADQTTIAERAGEIEQLITVAEGKLERLRRLAADNITPRSQVVDAEAELVGLRRRREIVRQTRVEPEVLRAPIDGVIANARVVAGQVVQSQDALFQIVHPEGFWAEALVYGEVDPTKIADATALSGDSTSMRLRFQGSSRALQQHATVVHFAILDPPASVSVGQPLTVVARNGSEVTGFILPRDAVVRAANGDALVWLHTAPERFEGRPVRTEAFDATRVVVRDGLKSGERVVVRGAELINQVR